MSVRVTNEDFVKKLKDRNPDIVPLESYAGNKTKIKLRCLKDGYEWSTAPSDLLRNDGVKHGCPVCANRACFTGYNDVATRRPDLLKYFVNKEEAKYVTEGSHKRIKVKCPDCGYEKSQVVKDLCTRGFTCNKCGDGVSFPNKFIRALLTQLNINGDYEYSPDWAQGRYYDAHFSYNGKEYIVQMDGEFHYIDNPMDKKSTAERSKEIDNLKDKMASEHNITMIRIDSRESTQEYLSEQINKSLLGDIFDLSKVDWVKCDEDATKNIAKIACEFYEQHHDEFCERDAAKALGISWTAFSAYFKKGLKFGWCKKHKAPFKRRKLQPELMEKVCRFYEENYKTFTKVETAKHFGINYTSFEECFKEGLKRGWCKNHTTINRCIKIPEDKEREMCAYYENYHAKYTKEEMAKHFGVNQRTFMRHVNKGIKLGWCHNHPRIAKNKANRK